MCIFYIASKFGGARYYKRAFGEFFLANDANIEKKSAASMTADYASHYHRFGWLLFLALRVHAFSRFKDLVTCTNGLVSILVSQLLVLLCCIIWISLKLLHISFCHGF